MQFELKIGKMSCVNCSNGIEKACLKLPGVREASVSYMSLGGVFLVDDEGAKQRIKDKIKALGFEILHDEEGLEKFKQMELRRLRIKFVISLILSALLMYFEMFVAGWASNLTQMILSFVVIFYCGFDFFSHAFKGILSKNLDMNVLVCLGAFCAFLYSLLVFLGVFENETNLYFSSGAMIVCFVLLGKNIEENIKQKARNYQKNLSQKTQQNAQIVLENGEIITKNASFIKKGDLMLVRQGQSVSADGVIERGECELDMSFLSGEFLPVFKKQGQSVQAGAFVLSGVLYVRASKKAMDSTLARLKELVFKAGSEKTPLISITNKISSYFVGAILLLACGVFAYHAVNSSVSVAIYHALATLLISCPCALGLATPVALSAAFSRAARAGILIKNMSGVEALAKIKSVIFDKTGTLTKNELEIFKHNLSQKDYEKLAYIESFSSHPLARAICGGVKNELKENESLQIIISKGIKFSDENDTYIIGNANLLRENGVDLSGCEGFVKMHEKLAQIQVFMARNGECVGVVLLKNELKFGAKELINELKNENIKSVILSGDNEKSVESVARKLEISEFKAGLSPAEKFEFIKGEDDAMFVGDGINDSAALSGARLGVSFINASELAKSSGDFLLLNDDLSKLGLLLRLGKKTRRIIKINLFWAFFYNVLLIPMAAGLVPKLSLSPHFAALAMSFSSVFVVLNSLRLRGFRG